VSRRPSRNLLSTLLASLLLAVTVLPVTSGPVEARDGANFVDIVNRYRADAGVPPVKLHGVVDEIAVQRAAQLAAARRLGHDFDYLMRRLDEEGVCWRAIGEVVAWNSESEAGRLEQFVSQWYHSDPHREVMLGSGYTHAGASWKTGSDGHHYAAMIFVKICGATAEPVTYAGFTDIADSKFRTSIAWVTKRGIMDGCRSTRFCPEAYLTRGQLASALANGLGLPATTIDFYADDDGTRHEDGINRLRAAGLTGGCGGGNYCPNRAVRRGQLATAIATALDLRATRTDYFRDDSSSRHEDNINRIAAAGISGGCGSGKFCPDARVRREQATAFLRNAFD
jgi:uncharacterized protein YkwD